MATNEATTTPYCILRKYLPHELVTHECIERRGPLELWRTTEDRSDRELPPQVRWHIREADGGWMTMLHDSDASHWWPHHCQQWEAGIYRTPTGREQLPQLIAERFPACASVAHELVAENEGVQLWHTVETRPSPDRSQRRRLHLMNRERLVASEISDSEEAWAWYDNEVFRNLDPDKRGMMEAHLIAARDRARANLSV